MKSVLQSDVGQVGNNGGIYVDSFQKHVFIEELVVIVQ